MVEGLRSVESALSSGCEVDFAVCTDGFGQTFRETTVLESLRKLGVEVFGVSERDISELSDTQSPQGVLIVLSQPRPNADLLYKGIFSTVLVACEIQDPGNLGSIIRTADGAGMGGVVLTRGTVDMYNPKVVRSTMSSIFSIPVFELDEDIEDVLERFRESGYSIVATDKGANVNYYDVIYPDRLALLVGNEARGLGSRVIKLADKVVKIPILGKAESLNVAVATGIVTYEIRRQRELRRRGGECGTSQS